MAKWQPSEAKKFARQLELNRPYYVLIDMSRWTSPYEDAQCYSEVVFTKRLPFTGNPCTEYGGSAATWCQNFGPVYDTPPRGIRNIAGPSPQVAGPLPDGYEAYLDEAELRGLEKRVRDSRK